jgi:hypothetical protein
MQKLCDQVEWETADVNQEYFDYQLEFDIVKYPLPTMKIVPTASVLTRSRPAESHRNRRQLCWQCGGTCYLRREA